MRKTLFIYITDLQQPASGWLLRDGEGPNNGRVESQQPGLPEARLAKNARVVLILGAENCLCMPAQFPGRKNLNAWRKAAPWILEDHLAEDSSEMHYAISPTAEESGKYLVAASQLAPLQTLLNELSQQQLEVDCITPDACLLPAANENQITSAVLGSRTLLKDINGACALPSSAASPMIGEQAHWLECDNALAALDSLSAEWDAQTSLNLRQGELAPGEAMAARLRPWRTAAIAASVAALVWSGVTAMHLSELKAENQDLRQEIAAVFKAALPGSRMVKPKAQMEQALSGNQSGNNSGFLLTLQAATAPLAQINDATLTSLDQRGSTLVMNLRATQISTVEQIRTAMNALPGYQAEVGSVRADPNNVQLRVTVRPATS
ncbi:MAG: type II secretion system protein GspL [Gammaproteobacteria bacterium]|nr:type II secretion system protein GspL [Gammaproteobacteria bacterium]